MPRIRTGYSFRAAAGQLSVVMDRLQECGCSCAPITDRASTFGWVRWNKLCSDRGLKPVFGVELAVTDSWAAKKPAVDYWTFIAIDDIEPVNRLVNLATQQFRYEPLLTYEDANAADGVFKIVGSRSKLDLVERDERTFLALSPSVARGYLKRAAKAQLPLVACSDNKFPRSTDQGFYEVVCGRNASTQTYDQHIQTPEEWRESVERLGLKPEDLEVAESNARWIMENSNAELRQATLVKPPRPKTLREMCEEGAEALGVDLEDPDYSARLERELELIKAKEFEDYFYLVAEICQWARKRMIVGPARGSSAGSLVCYLVGITTVDPLRHGLIFERFIDLNRTDLPDIDIDFSDQLRYMVFNHINDLYGRDHVARLGTVSMFKARSAIQEAGAALKIPKWKCDAVADSLIERSGGDSRALQTLEDTLKTTAPGQELLRDWPEVKVATEMEGHPRHPSQHAAGIVISDQPLLNYVAVDNRVAATMCDKEDAEKLNLLKIDALGLTQLSVFEDALELAGLPHDTLEKLPLDDQGAFDVLNNAKFAGIFQFTGKALQGLVKQIKVEKFDDIVAITALARPGPLATGGSAQWLRRRTGEEAPNNIHPMLTELTKDTYGVVVYQETVMRIVREMGKMSWEDTSAIRKAMSKRLGNEFFENFKRKFVSGAVEQGVDEETAGSIWDQINTFGSWAFNKCLSGDTCVWLTRTGGSLSKETSLEDLYDRFVKNPSRWIRNKGSMPYVWSLDDQGNVVEQRVKAIHKNGKRQINRYYFSDGAYVDCTPSHRFLVNGQWKPIGEASIGDEFSDVRLRPFEAERNGRGKGHAKGRRWSIGEDGSRSGESNVAWSGGISAEKKSFIEQMCDQPCEDCGRCKKRMEAHHNDFNSGKDRPSDLSWLCASCHKKRHYKAGRNRKNEKGLEVSHKVLFSVENLGWVETYDLEMPEYHNFALANGLLTHNSHAVSYGLVSYYCCWLKAHYPFEFAAATLSHESDTMQQITLLREMRDEGFDYVPVDPEQSREKWAVGERDGKSVLVGPLTNVKGIGPKSVQKVIECRDKNEPLPSSIHKKLQNPTTPIDSLWPIADAFRRLMPDPGERNIFTPPTPIKDLHPQAEDYEALIFCTVLKINPRDENENINVARRGYEITDGMTESLNLQLADDTDVIFGKVTRYRYKQLGVPIVNRGRVGKALYAMKGVIKNGSFRIFLINNVRYIGDMDEKENRDG